MPSEAIRPNGYAGQAPDLVRLPDTRENVNVYNREATR